jgi:hypothetical protein
VRLAKRRAANRTTGVRRTADTCATLLSESHDEIGVNGLVALVRRNLPGGLVTAGSAAVVALGGNVFPRAPGPGLWVVGVGTILLVAGLLSTPSARWTLDRLFGLGLTPDAVRTLVALLGLLALSLTAAFLAGNPAVVTDPAGVFGF